MKLSLAGIWSIPVLLVLSQPLLCLIFKEKSDDAAHGVRLSGNDQFTVFAMNIAELIILAFYPYKPSDQCTISYPFQNIYVYSLAALSNNDTTMGSELIRFLQVAENAVTENVQLSLFTVNKSNCTIYSTDTYILRQREHQEYMFLKVDPSQKFAYVFADWFILSFDIDNLHVSKEINMAALVPTSEFRTHAVDITDTYAIVVGFYVLPAVKDTSWFIALFLTLNPIRGIDVVDLNDGNTQLTSQALLYNRENDMSVAINPFRHMTIIGLPFLNKVILLTTYTSSSNYSKWNVSVIRIDTPLQECTGFGRSVAWVDNETVAIVALTVANRPWSQSEVWIFPVDRPFKIPLFVFPNSQQQIGLFPPPLFLQMFIWSGNLVVFTEKRMVLLVPSELAGFSSVWNIYPTHNILVYNSTPCIAGTYKDTPSFGPCTACPPQTKNMGSEPCTQCQPCTSISFCPLGSTNDLSLHTYPSYTQTFTYLDPPDMNNYDDLLVQNIFRISSLRRCIVASPLFWTIIVVTLCFMVWLLMTLSKFCNCLKGHFHRNRLKEFLKKADIVNEGERWIGGLFSFAIVLLFGFTFWFALEFQKLYPIETSGKSYASCDDTLRNAIFDSALQMPLSNPDGSRWAIFELLDTQPFTMTVDLLNTAVDCSSVTVQQNRPGVNYLRLQNVSYVSQPDNATCSVSFLLPAHRTNVQINITGPFFVGGMRLCLHGTGRVDGVHTLQALDMCQLLLTTNETLSRMTTVQIVLIKVINVTKPLKIGGATKYNGRWAPTFAESSLSDELIYEQYGHYLRYVSERTTVSISLSEQSFFVQNNQQPMVRRAELAFHTLLFCILIIELFGMGFLVFRLVVMPLIRTVINCRNRKKSNENMEEAPLPASTTVIPTILEILDVDNSDKLSRRSLNEKN